MPSHKLRIGMVSVDAPPHIGGMGRHVGSLVDGLRRVGDEVHVFDRSNRPLLYGVGRNIGFSFGLRRALTRWIWRHGIDVIHLHTGPGGALLRGRLPVPLVVTANHTYVDQSMLPGEAWKKYFVPWERATYRSADAVACLSDDTRTSVIDDYGVHPSTVSVIGCGFDLAPFIAADRDDREPYTAVFIGRPETRKGWDILMSAWTMVLHDIPEAVLHVVGFRDAERTGVQFHGRVADDELRRRVGMSSILVMPSRLEGFGLAAAEAISAGTPVVGCSVRGLRNVVSTTTGLLVQQSDIALAEAIKRVFFDDSLRTSLQKGCRLERSVFALDAEIDAYRELYDAVYSRACTQK